MTTNIVKFTPKPAPKVQDPWADLFADQRKWTRNFIMVGFALVGGAWLGVAAALGKLK